MEFVILVWGLLGFWGDFICIIWGEGIMNYSFLEYCFMSGDLEICYNGVMVVFEEGVVIFYVMKNVEDWGVFFIIFGIKVYKGMIIGEYNWF